MPAVAARLVLRQGAPVPARRARLPAAERSLELPHHIVAGGWFRTHRKPTKPLTSRPKQASV